MEKEEAPKGSQRWRLSRGWVYLGLLALILIVSLTVEYEYLDSHRHRRMDLRRRGLFDLLQNKVVDTSGSGKSQKVPVFDLKLPSLMIDSLPSLNALPMDSISRRLGFQLSAEYVKPQYHYALRYDSALYTISEMGGDEEFIFVRSSATGMGAVILDGELADYRNTLDPLIPCAMDEAERHCAADGDDASSWCEKRNDAQMFKSSTGLRVIEFYQTHFDRTRGQTTQTTYGPYYVVDLSQSGRRLGLLVYDDNEPSQNFEFVMREMVNSIKFVGP